MQSTDWRTRVALGKTGLKVSRIGLASSYGIGADGLQQAYEEYGINYFYWGTFRKESFGEGIRRLARREYKFALSDNEVSACVVFTFWQA